MGLSKVRVISRFEFLLLAVKAPGDLPNVPNVLQLLLLVKITLEMTTRIIRGRHRLYVDDKVATTAFKEESGMNKR